MILQPSPDSPAILHFAADAVLALHIAGGTIGIAAGFAALGLRKGQAPHRVAGHAFLVAMLAMAGVGATVSPILGNPLDTSAAVLALYLVATGWMAVRRPAGQAGRFERHACAVAIAATLANVFLARLAATDPAGRLGGYPPAAFAVLAAIFALAASGDLTLVSRGGSAGAARIVRHLWRMCVALFIAAGSFFLGQPRFQPEWLRGTSLVFVPELVILATMIYWLVKLRLRPGRVLVGPGRPRPEHAP